MTTSSSKDLVVLTADSQMERTIETLISRRYKALGITNISAEVIRHRNKDPGCRTASIGILTPLRRRFRKAMVVFDFYGSGAQQIAPPNLENELERQYINAGWRQEEIAFIVIEPELEAWVFGASLQHLERLIGWSQPQSMKEWLESREYLIENGVKPLDPQNALDELLAVQRKPRSAKLFADLAQRVSLSRCQDRAFQKFRATLQRWFPAQ